MDNILLNTLINKEHIKQILEYLWDDKLQHFQETYDVNFEDCTDFEDKEEIAKCINSNVKCNMTEHIFHTLLTLKYEIL